MARLRYATDAGLWRHPHGSFDEIRAHVDRVGCRAPDGASLSGRPVQRSLTPHLDCCPDALDAGAARRGRETVRARVVAGARRGCRADKSAGSEPIQRVVSAGGGKRWPRWRPIQCFLALDDALAPDEGGFECCPGFHSRFSDYYAARTAAGGGDALPCVGDYLAVSTKRDASVLAGFRHVPVPAGAAVFWDQRIPHANARRNQKSECRRVVYGGFLPRVPRNEAFLKEQRRRLIAGEPQADFWTKGGGVAAPPDHAANASALSPDARSLLGFCDE